MQYPARAFRWSPDGKHAAAAGGKGERAVLIWDMTTRAVVNSLSHHTAIISLSWSPAGTQIALVRAIIPQHTTHRPHTHAPGADTRRWFSCPRRASSAHGTRPVRQRWPRPWCPHRRRRCRYRRHCREPEAPVHSRARGHRPTALSGTRRATPPPSRPSSPTVATSPSPGTGSVRSWALRTHDTYDWC
jgi:WD40 repeat protein